MQRKCFISMINIRLDIILTKGKKKKKCITHEHWQCTVRYIKCNKKIKSTINITKYYSQVGFFMFFFSTCLNLNMLLGELVLYESTLRRLGIPPFDS